MTFLAVIGGFGAFVTLFGSKLPHKAKVKIGFSAIVVGLIAQFKSVFIAGGAALIGWVGANLLVAGLIATNVLLVVALVLITLHFSRRLDEIKNEVVDVDS